MPKYAPYHFSQEDCTFYVNEEKRTVACVLENTERMFFDFISDNLYIDPDPFSFRTITNYAACGHLIKKLYMPNRFVGIAKCAPEDEWNEALGRKIAYTKLREKVYHKFFKKANIYIHTVDDWIDKSMEIINGMGAKLDKEMENRYKYINDKVNK